MARMKYFEIDPPVFTTNLAMHRASKEGKLERVRQLIEDGMFVDSRDNRGRTPLYWAAGSGQYEVVDFLSSLPECDLNLRDCYDRTPLLQAAMEGRIRVVHLLLERGAQVSCAHEDYKKTVLHHASRQGWADTVHRILDRGESDINAATKWGNTPLIKAAVKGHKDVAALLVRAGADVNRSNIRKETALHRAVFEDHTQVVRVLLETKGLELNPQDRCGDTPLHYACYMGHREVIKLLLVAGADTTLKNNNGKTALSEGIRAKKLPLEIIRLFVQHGGFLANCDYMHISQNQVLRRNILKDVGLCTQSIVNKFHGQSLPALSSISYFARKLPNVDKFKLKARQTDEVENSVRCEIERNTYCNVVKAHPMALSALCVLSLITCQSGGKRFASPDFGDGNFTFKKFRPMKFR